MKTYLEWHYNEKPPSLKVLEVAVKLDNKQFTRRAIYDSGKNKWFDNERLWELPSESQVYAWAYIPDPPPVDIDAAVNKE